MERNHLHSSLLIMMFTFPRVSAGIYEVQKNSETVGFIRKASSQKWIVTDVVDTPQHVTKTLKEAKDACINLIIFDTSQEQEQEVEVVEDTSEVVNEELNSKVEGSLNFYTVGNPYAVPTLDPMIF